MIEYPKIETLYERDEKTFKVNPDKIRLPEFQAVKSWEITEKIDGTNIRIALIQDGNVKIGGRTDSAQIYTLLAEYLYETFTFQKLQEIFWKPEEQSFDVLLFGEGYGEKIQSGGKYCKGISFRLFDILIDKWWLKRNDIESIAEKLGIRTVPKILNFLSTEDFPKTSGELKNIISSSIVSGDENPNFGKVLPEGIVAREPNGLLTRSGKRLMWKIKFRDF